jgi:hypothetical protein
VTKCYELVADSGTTATSKRCTWSSHHVGVRVARERQPYYILLLVFQTHFESMLRSLFAFADHAPHGCCNLRSTPTLNKILVGVMWEIEADLRWWIETVSSVTAVQVASVESSKSLLN